MQVSFKFIFTKFRYRLLKEKQDRDEDFVALCQLRRGAAKYSMEDLLQLPVSHFSYLNFFQFNNFKFFLALFP